MENVKVKSLVKAAMAGALAVSVLNACTYQQVDVRGKSGCKGHGSCKAAMGCKGKKSCGHKGQGEKIVVSPVIIAPQIEKSSCSAKSGCKGKKEHKEQNEHKKHH